MNTERAYSKYLAAGIFALVYLCLLPMFQYKIVSDMVSYLTIGKNIAAGHFFESVNGYWSPLISWLVAPLMLLGIEGVLAYKLWNLVAGFIVLVQAYQVASSYTPITWQRLVVPLLFIPNLLYFSLCNATPDIIALACWFLFFNQLRLLLQFPSFRTAVLTGCLAGLCYLAKYYNFYAAICFFAAACGWIWYSQKPNLFKYVAGSFVVFAGMSLVWITILHSKFGVWSPTTASDFNMNLIRPGGFMHPMQVGDRILPIDYSQFTITSWEQPNMYPIPQWSPLESWESLRYHVTVHIRDNFMHFRNKHPIEVCLFALSLLVAFVYRKKFALHEWVLLISIVLYPIGYFWMIALSRYALFSICLLTLWCVICINNLPKFNILAWIVLGLGMVYSFNISYHRMKDDPDKGKNYALFYESTTQSFPVNKQHILSSPSCWAPALYFSYYTDSRLYDVLKPELLESNADTIQQLGITYYFCKREEVPTNLTAKIVFEGDWVLVALR